MPTVFYRDNGDVKLIHYNPSDLAQSTINNFNQVVVDEADIPSGNGKLVYDEETDTLSRQ